jgi:hypothetical protein
MMIEPPVTDETQGTDATMRRLRIVLMCIVGCVGLWDVTATFGPGHKANDLAGRGEVRCDARQSRDGRVSPQNDRCQSLTVR